MLEPGSLPPPLTLEDADGRRVSLAVPGVIRSTVWIGPDGRVRRHWARVSSAAAHPDKVLDAIRAG